jgi:phosphoglycerol transferase MdoB-like AlkP superfamily enzyme
MYGSGFRTEQGLVSIFSGFPAQPNNSIITTPSKAEQLPSLNSDLGKQGYQSSFYYGGEVEFANMKSYLMDSNFGKIIDKDNFDKNQLNSKWGAHDEFVFKKQLDALKNEKQPFLSVVLTLSTHEPFEVPMQTPFTGGEEPERFKKAAYYTDYCLFNYFNEAKKQSWYSNTIFILVADHGHHLPKNRNMNFPEGRRITAMIMGGALADSLRGKTVDKICNQNDIVATLLTQLNLPTENYKWSKDVFNDDTMEFAYYSNENCLGWVTPQQNIVYSYTSQTVEELQPKIEKKLDKSILIQAKAYLQTLYQQYLDY